MTSGLTKILGENYESEKKKKEETKNVKEYEIHFSNEADKMWNAFDDNVKAEILVEIYNIAYRRKWGIKLENFYFPTPNGKKYLALGLERNP